MLNLSVHINIIYIFILLCLFAKLDFCFRNFSIIDVMCIECALIEEPVIKVVGA